MASAIAESVRNTFDLLLLTSIWCSAQISDNTQDDHKSTKLNLAEKQSSVLNTANIVDKSLSTLSAITAKVIDSALCLYKEECFEQVVAILSEAIDSV